MAFSKPTPTCILLVAVLLALSGPRAHAMDAKVDSHTMEGVIDLDALSAGGQNVINLGGPKAGIPVGEGTVRMAEQRRHNVVSDGGLRDDDGGPKFWMYVGLCVAIIVTYIVALRWVFHYVDQVSLRGRRAPPPCLRPCAPGNPEDDACTGAGPQSGRPGGACAAPRARAPQ